MQPPLDLAARAFDLGMAGMADQHHIIALFGVTAALDMHLDHQRAGRVDHVELTIGGHGFNMARNAMGAEHGDRAFGNFVHLGHEHGTARPELLHHMGVVHDLVPHVDRCTMDLQRPLDNLDSADHASAEAARIGHQNLQRLQLWFEKAFASELAHQRTASSVARSG